jgi:ubiquinone/menaquinone biosynthesis C-methylase UbiE
MQIKSFEIQPVHEESECLDRMLPWAGARILELGCGDAQTTRQLAANPGIEQLVAVEIDSIQHSKNLGLTQLPNVLFKSYGAERILELDESFDIVLMFKSLHHVPMDQMGEGLNEISRVLRPNGLLYVSEPVFAGEFNDIMRLFNDEDTVRIAAFEALSQAVDEGQFELVEEYFFKNSICFDSLEQFENRILNVTHSDYELTTNILDEVRRRFASHKSPSGFTFEIPNRVDLLEKKG